MNVLDSRTLLGRLAGKGFAPAESEDEADAFVIFTCSVRLKPEEKVFSRIGRLSALKKRRPWLVIGVAGCLAERLGEGVIARAPMVDVVAGPGSLDRLVDYLASPMPRPPAVFTGFPASGAACASGFGREGPSALVSVMTGCRRFCSYCIVPYVRGPEASRKKAEIVSEVENLVRGGAVEITLLGQNISAYGRDVGEDLAGLLSAVCSVPGIRRVRFLTSHPADFDPGLLPAFRGSPVLCAHLQMPAQSGSDRILERMNRGYGSARYLELVDMARDAAPGTEITSDFIVGFPGETDADFEATLGLVRRAGFRNVFAFKFVPRPGTAAAGMPDDVPPAVKQQRLERLLRLQRDIGLRRNKAMVGSIVEVMVEGPDKKDPGRSSGRTRENHIVSFAGRGNPGDFSMVSVTDAGPLMLFGEPV